MKKTIFLLLILVVLVLLSCRTNYEKVARSIGEYDKEEFYSCGGFQDYTDYAKYYYSSVNFENNQYFSKVTLSDIATFNQYVTDFEDWLDSHDPNEAIVKKYDLDRSIIDENDYIYIYDKMGEPIGEGAYEQFEYYDVYLFDTQASILYYFHQNI